MIIELINPTEVYTRIKNGKPYGKNLKPYPKKILFDIIQHFEVNEEYEKCLELKEFIDFRFKHEGFYKN